MGGLLSMSNDNTGLIIIRSRFQPFTKFHTATIQHALSKKQQVALCIIRDYETVSRFHRMSPAVSSVDLRHLPIFNPFSSWEVSFHIISCLQNKFPNCSIPIIISPLKFSELIELLTSDNDNGIPQDLEKFMISYKCDQKTFNECIIKENLGRIISNIGRDNMPSFYGFNWLFGMFDLEDVNDCAKVSNYVTTQPEQYKPDNLPSYKLYDLTIGLYGQFMLWIYIQFVEVYIDVQYKWNSQWPLRGPKDLQNKDFLFAEKNKLEKLLENYVDNKIEFQKYKDKVSWTLINLLDGFNNIPSHERDVLLNFSRFIQLANTSIKVVE